MHTICLQQIPTTSNTFQQVNHDLHNAYHLHLTYLDMQEWSHVFECGGAPVNRLPALWPIFSKNREGALVYFYPLWAQNLGRGGPSGPLGDAIPVKYGMN